MKKCIKCGELKSFSEFHKDNNRKDGLQSWCKECRKEYQENNKDHIKKRQKEYRKNNKEQIQKQQIESYNKNPHINWAKRTIRTHKKNDITCLFTPEELAEKAKTVTHCSIFGFELDYTRGNGFQHNGASLENKYRKSMITLDDIIIVSNMANCAKNSWLIDVLLEGIDFASAHKKEIKKIYLGDN